MSQMWQTLAPAGLFENGEDQPRSATRLVNMYPRADLPGLTLTRYIGFLTCPWLARVSNEGFLLMDSWDDSQLYCYTRFTSSKAAGLSTATCDTLSRRLGVPYTHLYQIGMAQAWFDHVHTEDAQLGDHWGDVMGKL